MNSVDPSFQTDALSSSLDAERKAAIDLMPIEDALEHDDIALLKAQLESAHTLLRYQQNVVHSLTEQMQLKDRQLLQTENKLDTLQQHCQSHTVELAEMRSICSDLRSQLKRQTRRSQPVQQSLVSSSSQSLGFEIDHPVTSRTAVSFGYESASSIEPEAPSLIKASPVKAWSAPQETLIQQEVTFCKKLTTFVVSKSARVTTIETKSYADPAPQQSAPPQPHTPRPHRSTPVKRSSSSHSVELPRFAAS